MVDKIMEYVKKYMYHFFCFIAGVVVGGVFGVFF